MLIGPTAAEVVVVMLLELLEVVVHDHSLIVVEALISSTAFPVVVLDVTEPLIGPTEKLGEVVVVLKLMDVVFQ